MRPTYLYIKTQTSTGLKYFGKTISDPIKYSGSGTVWLRYLKKHGYEHTTTLLNDGNPYTDAKLLTEAASKFSEDNDIVKSAEWANLMPETGFTGGKMLSDYTPVEYELLCKRNKEILNRPEVKQQLSESRRNRSVYTKEKTSASGKVSQNKPETVAAKSKSILEVSKNKIECPHCQVLSAPQCYGRWHGDNCKANPNLPENKKPEMTYKQIIEIADEYGIPAGAKYLDIPYLTFKHKVRYARIKYQP